MQQSATVPPCLAIDSSASSRVPTPIRKLCLFLAILIIPMLCTADDHTSDSRYKDLGHRVICTCDRQAPTGMGAKGCRAALLECDHLDCPTSKRMQHELKAAVESGDTDEMILNSFVQKYGAGVLQVPREMNNRLVWIFALAILATTCAIIIAFLRKQRSRVAMLTNNGK